MVDWKDLSLAVLRHVAKFYNKQVKIVGISKMKKADLTAELQKHLDLSGTTFTHKKYKDIKMDFEEDIPEAPPRPTVKADKSYTKKVVARKVVQAREASVNAEAIAEQAKAMGQSIAERKKIMDEREKQVQKKGKAQARRAVGDAKAIAPPKMEEEKKSADEVKVKDLVRAKMDDKIYYRNRFYDNSVAYGIVKNKVMIIGKAIEDYNDLEIFDKPKEIPSNVRFYTDDDKPIKTLNDLQEAGSSAPPKASSAPPKAPPAPAVATGDKSYKKKVVAKKVVQARGASADAMAIAPPVEEKRKETMEEFKKRIAEETKAEHKKKVEEATAKGEKYIPPTRLESLSAETKQKVNVLLRLPKVRLKEGIKTIAESMGAKLPRGILTTPMYSDKMKAQLPTYALGGRNDKDQRLMLEDAIGRNGMNLSPRSREEFMNKLYDLLKK